MLLAAACTIASLCVGFRTVAAVRRARRRVYGFRRAVVPPVSEPLALYDDPTDAASAAPVLTLHLVHPVDSPSSPRKRSRWPLGRGDGCGGGDGGSGSGGLLERLVPTGLPWAPWTGFRRRLADEEGGGGEEGGAGDAAGSVLTGSPVGCIIGELGEGGSPPAVNGTGEDGAAAQCAAGGRTAADDGWEVLVSPPPSSTLSTPRLDGGVPQPPEAGGQAPGVQSPREPPLRVLYSPVGAAADGGVAPLAGVGRGADQP